METVPDKRSGVVNTSEQCKVGEVIFERFKVNGVSIKVGEDPTLFIGHQT